MNSQFNKLVRPILVGANVFAGVYGLVPDDGFWPSFAFGVAAWFACSMIVEALSE